MKHIVVENGFITEVRCPLCQAPIQTMVPHEKYISVERINHQIVKRVPCSLRPNNNFRQIVLEVTDGKKKGKHVTICCKSCLGELNTQQMQQIYAIDIAEFERGGMDKKTLHHLMTFRPTKCLGEEPLYE